ncbi:MAG: T9SS type A sorting domain-containing protein [Flavobacteriales bacterium]
MYRLLFPALFLFSLQANAQFKTQPIGQPLSFAEMQRQFIQWKSTRTISLERGWKPYKRWEYDQLYHTTPNGEPVNANYYLEQVLRATEAKNAAQQNRAQQTGTWFSEGPHDLPPSPDPTMQHGLGRINCMAFHPTNPSTYWVGVAQGGVWKTEDNGNSWVPLTDNLPITRVSDIAVDPNNADIMYISLCDFEYIDVSLTLDYRKRNTHYGLGLYKTTDGGVNWQPTGLAFTLQGGDATLIRKILIHPTNTNQLVAAGTSGMYTSNNGGTNWTQVLDSLFWDLVQDPVTPNTLYASTGFLYASQQGYASVMKSTDFGQTWTLLNTGIPTTNQVERIKLAIAPSNPNIIYAITTDLSSGLYGIYKSTNAGVNWNLQFNSLNLLDWDEGLSIGGQGTYDLVFMVNPTNPNAVYAGGVNLWGSTDGAVSFDPISYWVGYYGPSIHADQHMLTYQPSTGRYFICNDGGIYHSAGLLSENWGNILSGSFWPTVWTNISDGLTVTSFYRISSSRVNDGRIMAGAQDNSTHFFNGTSWTTVIGGDGMDNVIDPGDPSTYIGMWQYGGMAKTIDGGLNFNYFAPTGETGEWTTPIIADYITGDLYAGYANVHVSSDFGDNWTPISNFQPEPTNFYYPEICAMAVSASNSQVLMAARRPRYEYGFYSTLYRTANGGASWQNITTGLPDSLYFTAVDISHDNPNIAWVSCAGFSPGNKVFKTSNGGTSWQNISSNLPDLPVNVIKQIPGSAVHGLLAGTDVGLYYTDDTSSGWIPWSNGLPNVIVTDIEPNMAEGKIYISTFGRGVWSTGTSDLLSVNTTVQENQDFEIFPVPATTNENVTVSYSHPLSGEVEINWYDVNGKLVNQYAFMKSGSLFSQVVPVTVAAGSYVIKISGPGFEAERKIVIE